jgi:hypothetical protein
LDVDVGAEPGVVGQVPAVVIGIGVDDDVIAVPQPVTDVIVVVGRYAEVKAIEKEAIAVASAQVVDVSAANAAGEAAVLPRMIEMVVGIVAAGIVTYPLIIVVDVRSFGVVRLVAEGGASIVLRTAFQWAGFWCAIVLSAILLGVIVARRGVVGRCRAVRRDVTAAYIASTAAMLVLATTLGVSGISEKKRRNGQS